MRSISCFGASILTLFLTILLVSNSNSNTFVAAQRGDSRTPQQNEGGDDIASIILYSVFGAGFIIFVVSLLVYAYYCKDHDETSAAATNGTDNSPTSNDTDDDHNNDKQQQQDSSKNKKQQKNKKSSSSPYSRNSHSASDDNNNNNNYDLQEVVSNANTHDPTADNSFVSSGGLPASEGCRGEDSSVQH